MLHRYVDLAATLERALVISPDDIETKGERAIVDLKASANPASLHALIDQISCEQSGRRANHCR